MDEKDEKRMLELVRAAAELEEFEADVHARLESDSTQRAVSRSVAQWIKRAAPVLAVAAVLIFLLFPAQLAFEQATVTRSAVRAVDAEIELEITLSRPAYLRVVIIDHRNERWIHPISEPSTYVVKVDQHEVLRMPPVPESVEPRPGEPRFAVLIASTDPPPTAEELLRRIPDPVAPPESDEATVRRALERVAADLTRTYGCAVRIEPIPE